MFKPFLRSELCTPAIVFLLASNVTLANSTSNEASVYSWGRWSDKYQTAAGGELNTEMVKSLAPQEPRRDFKDFVEVGSNPRPILPIQTAPSNHIFGFRRCYAAAFCGFTAIYEEGNDGYSSEVGQLHLKPEGERYYSEGYAEQTEAAFAVGGNDGYQIEWQNLEGSIGLYSGSFRSEEDQDGNYYRVYYEQRDNDGKVIIGRWLERKGYSVFDEGRLVAGFTTSLAQLNMYVSSLNGAIATYNGTTDDHGSFGLSINFDSQTWSGEWTPSESGKPGFAVTDGEVKGINFRASTEQLSQDVSGVVAGAFFGQRAEHVQGLIDITKTTPGGEISRKTVFTTIDLIDEGQ